MIASTRSDVIVGQFEAENGPPPHFIQLGLDTLMNNASIGISQLIALDQSLMWLQALLDRNPSETSLRVIMNKLVETTRSYPEMAIAIANSQVVQKLIGAIGEASPALPFHTQVRMALLIHEQLLVATNFDMAKLMQQLLPLEPKKVVSLCNLAIKEHAKIGLHPLTPIIVKRGLEELSRHEGLFCWYNDFFSCLYNVKMISTISSAMQTAHLGGLSAAIALRHKQIRSLPLLHDRISDFESLATSYYIEAIAQASFSMVSRRIKKEQFRPPYSLHHDRERGNFVILFKSKPRTKAPLLYIKSGFKKVTAGFYLPNDTQAAPFLVAQSVNGAKATIEDLRNEVAVHKKFNGKRAIWPILDACEYNNLVPKISIITPWAQGNLHKLLIDERRPFSDTELVTIFTELTWGLFLLHREGYIHGDVKLSNILINLSPTLQVGYIDFGFAFRPTADPPRGYFAKGFYGSLFCTPPEMLERGNCNVDLFKAEMFALGVALYTILKRDGPSWIPIIMQNRQVPFPANSHTQVAEELLSTIETPLQALLQKKTKSLHEALTIFVFSMLQLNPAFRPSAEKAKEEIRLIKETCVR